MPSDEERYKYRKMLDDAVEGLINEEVDKDDIVDQVLDTIKMVQEEADG